jgi:U3 small nucleolar ribonucleoprotein protein LCP5
VDSMIESRIVLEKIKTLEAKLRYQIEKLVRVAEEPESSSNIVDGM